MMHIIIPARFASSRLPGKPLMQIRGKPLLQWTWEAAQRTASPVTVATDDREIFDAAKGFGADVVFTSVTCRNGTERCAEAAANMRIWEDVVVNWQGDAPLMPPEWASELAAAVREGYDVDVATPIIDSGSEEFSAGKVSVVVDVSSADWRAMYFSRALIPPRGPWFIHAGMYAYDSSALREYGRRASLLEESEDLEQLRWLSMGKRVVCIPFGAEYAGLREVNVMEDIQAVADMLGHRHEAAGARDRCGPSVDSDGGAMRDRVRGAGAEHSGDHPADR